LRDACIVALGLRAMRRAAELARLRMEDVVFRGGLLRVWIARSKTDQLAKGMEIVIEPMGQDTCPVMLMRQFLRWRGSGSGLLFRSSTGGKLSSGAISSICQRMVKACGRKEVVSSHSLRIGGATAAVEGGLMREKVMTIGGWTSDAINCYLQARELPEKAVSHHMGL
jgi:integrase